MNVRRDQSSRFAPEHRTGVFPSVSVGWRVSEESFMKSLKDSRVIDALKFRLSWGQSGNQFTGTNFAYLPSLAINSFYALDNSVVRGPAPIVFANKDLKWETSVQTDFEWMHKTVQKLVALSQDIFTASMVQLLGNHSIFQPSYKALVILKYLTLVVKV